MNRLDDVIKKNEDMAWRVIEGEALIVDPRKNLIYPVNSVGARVWELLDGKRPCRDIIETVRREFDCGGVDIESDINEFLCDAVEKGIAERCV